MVLEFYARKNSQEGYPSGRSIDGENRGTKNSKVIQETQVLHRFRLPRGIIHYAMCPITGWMYKLV